MWFERFIHRRHHHQIPWIEWRYTWRCCIKYFGFTNTWRRYFKRYRWLSSWRIYLLWSCCLGHHGKTSWTWCFKADVLAFSQTSGIWRIQRKNKQVNWFMLLILDWKCFQCRQQLFWRKSINWGSFALLSRGFTKIYCALLSRRKGRTGW